VIEQHPRPAAAPPSPGTPDPARDAGSIPWWPLPAEHPGFTLARAFVVTVLLVWLLPLLGIRDLQAWTAIGLAIAWCVTDASVPAAAAAGAIGWAMQTGFGIHRFGELSFSGVDLHHLGAIVVAAAAVAILAGHARRLRHRAVR
jgi:hypothetical protein